MMWRVFLLLCVAGCVYGVATRDAVTAAAAAFGAGANAVHVAAGLKRKGGRR